MVDHLGTSENPQVARTGDMERDWTIEGFTERFRSVAAGVDLIRADPTN